MGSWFSTFQNYGLLICWKKDADLIGVKNELKRRITKRQRKYHETGLANFNGSKKAFVEVHRNTMQ